MYVITVERDSDYQYHVYMGEVKERAAHSVVTQKRMLGTPPALIAFAYGNDPTPGKILYKGTFFESIAPIYDVAGAAIWSNPLHPSIGDSFTIKMENRLYTGSFSYVERVNRNEVMFKDGSVLKGVHALFIFFEYEKRYHKRTHLVDASYECQKKLYVGFTDPRALYAHFYDAYLEKEPVDVYSGAYTYDYTAGSSLDLERYELPLYNNTPYALQLQKEVWSHPKRLLERSVSSSDYSRARWTEHPWTDGLFYAKTVLDYDPQYKEIVVSIKNEE